jgi:hypothetical protein
MPRAILAGVVVVLWAILAAPAFGADVQPWDGTNPFRCDLQYAGEGTLFQHPDVDPFCVEYDKTHQDLSELGLVKFLMKEPARVSAAVHKCWYYQRDHWTGQIVAGDDSTETYHFDGSYFFDKRYGYGGVHVENFTINHETADPSQLSGFPPDWKPYFGPGRGGVMFLGNVNVNRNCLPHGGPGEPPYVHPGSYNGGTTYGPPPGGKNRLACRKLGGAARRGLGLAHLGQRRSRIIRALGQPVSRGHGFLHFCIRSGGGLSVHFGRRARADLVISNAKSFHAGKVRVGSRLNAARRALRGEQVMGRKGGNVVLGARHRSWRLLVGVRRRRVIFIAAASSGLTGRRLGGLLLASGR